MEGDCFVMGCGVAGFVNFHRVIRWQVGCSFDHNYYLQMYFALEFDLKRKNFVADDFDWDAERNNLQMYFVSDLKRKNFAADDFDFGFDLILKHMDLLWMEIKLFGFGFDLVTTKNKDLLWKDTKQLARPCYLNKGLHLKDIKELAFP
eukprot:CAMPEP_0117041392 /NCGR_PEP_ID=MMETSP0472-20121206/28911_1 /TAXON_ID=693140 ORGANISM="Tiarina fusus, Strain LIS" /NCGR_SAMPLE_ID=MMETSP0472 /ASSEMBLY_ACC=CAM_ASM_000603 /LENGTH=147 /DNA_ID=CAMNT_0004752393 /DNA_START=258 /DNA_END=701 /DNA_ORIENTATION=+